MIRRGMLVVGLGMVCLFSVGVSATFAAGEPTPAWSVQVPAEPTSFSAEENTPCEEQRKLCEKYDVVLTNVGGRSSGGAVTLVDTLPEGIETAGTPGGNGWACTTAEVSGHEVVTCVSEREVPALSFAQQIVLPIVVAGASGTPVNRVEVSGGGAVGLAVAETPTPIGAGEEPFGTRDFEASLLESAGGPVVQAGSHPGAFSVSFMFPTSFRVQAPGADPEPWAVQEVKQIITDLPPGVIGDALAAPRCPLSAVVDLVNDPEACPASSVLGNLVLFEPPGATTGVPFRIYNVTPEYGFPAEFAVFEPSLERSEFLYASLVGSGADAHVRVISGPQDSLAQDDGVSLTFFGDPHVSDGAPLAPQAFFTAPSDCEASGFTSTLYVDSWQQPGRVEGDGQPDLSDPNWKRAESTMPPVSGCEALQFHPTLSLAPTTTSPDSPTGLNVNLAVAQNEDPNGLATPPLRATTVTLPEGLVVSPSSATGLEGCSDGQIDLESPVPGSCPAGSQIGEVTVHTPLLEEPLQGEVYLGSPECDPCSSGDAQSGRMVRLFIQAHSERFGVTIKVPGVVKLDPVTGQLVSTFENLPQQPFSSLQFKFKEGPRAPLSTPSACGSYQTVSTLTPWSSPYTPEVTSSSSFTINGCSSNPFAPAFAAGNVGTEGGRYSSFSLSFSRTDSEQNLSSLEMVLPPGLLAKLTGVVECGETEINAERDDVGECPVSAQIGTVTAAAGPGSDPFQTSGKVYLTGPYNNGSYGEVTVVPAVAGPFNLGNVVVRGSIRINPVTGQASVTSDPFPTILDGVPLQLRAVHVSLERPGFTLNATSCEHMALTGTLVSIRGASANESTPYQVAGCQSMPFHPTFIASSNAQTSKLGGAALDVKITTRQGPDRPVGEEEANIHKADVELPLALPSRLSTLHQACLEKQFAEDPGGCPAGSVVGAAVADTPLLPSPLEGPAILVSHGGAAFPDLVLVLQGDNVLILLTGHTDIKKGITYSNFDTAPDAPVENFELKLPEGPHSALAANGNLCAPTRQVTVTKKITRKVDGRTRHLTIKTKKTEPTELLMPTSIIGQNGATFKQTTKITVTGCPKKPAKKAKTAKARN